MEAMRKGIATEQYPHGLAPQEAVDEFIEALTELWDEAGGLLNIWAPSAAGDPAAQAAFGRYLRSGASRAQARCAHSDERRRRHPSRPTGDLRTDTRYSSIRGHDCRRSKLDAISQRTSRARRYVELPERRPPVVPR